MNWQAGDRFVVYSIHDTDSRKGKRGVVIKPYEWNDHLKGLGPQSFYTKLDDGEEIRLFDLNMRSE